MPFCADKYVVFSARCFCVSAPPSACLPAYLPECLPLQLRRSLAVAAPARLSGLPACLHCLPGCHVFCTLSTCLLLPRLSIFLYLSLLPSLPPFLDLSVSLSLSVSLCHFRLSLSLSLFLCVRPFAACMLANCCCFLDLFSFLPVSLFLSLSLSLSLPFVVFSSLFLCLHVSGALPGYIGIRGPGHRVGFFSNMYVYIIQSGNIGL